MQIHILGQKSVRCIEITALRYKVLWLWVFVATNGLLYLLSEVSGTLSGRHVKVTGLSPIPSHSFLPTGSALHSGSLAGLRVQLSSRVLWLLCMRSWVWPRVCSTKNKEETLDSCPSVLIPTVTLCASVLDSVPTQMILPTFMMGC